MHAHLRAAADKLIFDIATIEHVAGNLPKKALERQVEATGRSLRQTFVAMAAAQEQQLALVKRIAAGEALSAAELRREVDFQPTKASERAKLKELLKQLDRARDGVIAAYAGFDDALATTAVGDDALGDVLLESAHHLEPFALDLVEALPELLFDPLLLNWALHADFAERPALRARQERYYAALTAAIEAEHAANPGGGADDDGEGDDDD